MRSHVNNDNIFLMKRLDKKISMALLVLALMSAPSYGGEQPAYSIDSQNASPAVKHLMELYKEGQCSIIEVMQAEEAELLARICKIGESHNVKAEMVTTHAVENNPMVLLERERMKKGVASIKEVQQAQEECMRIMDMGTFLSAVRGEPECGTLISRLKYVVECQLHVAQEVYDAIGDKKMLVAMQVKRDEWFPVE